MKNLNIAEKLESELEKKGFKVTQDPSKANFMIQANLLKSWRNR